MKLANNAIRTDLDLIFISERGNEANYTTISFKDAIGTKYRWRTYTPPNGSNYPKFFTECVCKIGHICKVRATIVGLDGKGVTILTRVTPRTTK